MFIDSTYFVGEIMLPNIIGANSNATQLAQAIAQYEKEILIQLLGYKLYSLLVADLVEGEPQTQVFKDLVNGCEFTHTYMGHEYLLKWEGLKNDAKQSLLAYYTFYKYVERDITHLSGVGTILAKGEKGSRASSVNKMVNAWERMRTLYGTIPPHFRGYHNHSIYGYISPINQLFPSMVFNPEPCAYNFLFANKANYPDWIFTPQWNINAFGI